MRSGRRFAPSSTPCSHAISAGPLDESGSWARLDVSGRVWPTLTSRLVHDVQAGTARVRYLHLTEGLRVFREECDGDEQTVERTQHWPAKGYRAIRSRPGSWLLGLLALLPHLGHR